MFRVAAGLHRRLLVLLLFPLPVLTLFGIWYDYESTDTLSVQLDYKLQRLMPLLVESVFVRGKGDDQAVVVLLAPPIGDFLSGRNGPTAFSIRDMLGNVVAGSDWMSQRVPGTAEPDYYSEEEGGVVYRIAAQKISTSAGDVVLFLADGSDPRQQWLRALVWKVVVPNLMLMGVAVLLVNWAVNRALKPLLDLKDAVENRSPRDLSPIDPMSSPEEVRPLVQSLNRLFELVNAQTESQRRFVADAAHQLRTPLAGLQAQVEAWAQALVAAASPPPTGARYVSNKPPGKADVAAQSLTLKADQILRLRDATRRTSQLAHQLLALSRADARNPDTASRQHTDLQDLCETLLETHLDHATERDIDLGLDTQPTHVLGHDWLLRELLNNLLDNALKYTPSGGQVTLRCGLRDGLAFLEVEDNGPGVPPEHREKVLERFYRVPGVAAEGTGLGLAIAAEIARVHRCRLELGAGLMEQGLRVVLTFPPDATVTQQAQAGRPFADGDRFHG